MQEIVRALASSFQKSLDPGGRRFPTEQNVDLGDFRLIFVRLYVITMSINNCYQGFYTDDRLDLSFNELITVHARTDTLNTAQNDSRIKGTSARREIPRQYGEVYIYNQAYIYRFSRCQRESYSSSSQRLRS